MKFRLLDENNDWVFGRGKQCFARDNKAVGLDIKTRLLSWVNDCFFDMGAGIDWLNRLGSKGQRELLEADLRRVILQTQDVTGLLDFQTTLVGRRFSASYSVETKYSKSYQDEFSVEL